MRFRQEQRSQLEKYRGDAKPIVLLNCEVKRARQSEELEVVMKSGTRVEASPKKFEVHGDLSLNATTEITLDGLQSKSTMIECLLLPKQSANGLR